MNKKKIVTLLTSTLMIMCVFTACGNNSTAPNNSNSSNNNTNNSSATTITNNTSKDANLNTKDANLNTKDNLNNSSSNDKNDSITKKEESLADTYNKYMSTTTETVNYRGYAEYGYDLTLVSRETKDDTTTYSFNGTMADGIGPVEGKPDRVFALTYEVTDDQIRETIINSDVTNKYTDRLNSLVANHIVMKGPIKLGTSWTQVTNIDGKDFTAETTITEVTDTTFSTKTIIKDFSIDGKVYDEERVYELGNGLIHFSANLDGEFFLGYTLNK